MGIRYSTTVQYSKVELSFMDIIEFVISQHAEETNSKFLMSLPLDPHFSSCFLGILDLVSGMGVGQVECCLVGSIVCERPPLVFDAIL